MEGIRTDAQNNSCQRRRDRRGRAAGRRLCRRRKPDQQTANGSTASYADDVGIGIRGVSDGDAAIRDLGTLNSCDGHAATRGSDRHDKCDTAKRLHSGRYAGRTCRHGIRPDCVRRSCGRRLKHLLDVSGRF